MFQGVSATQFLRELYQSSNEDGITNGAAVLGFYLTLAVFPAAILTMATIPYLPIQRVDQAIMDLLRQAMPPDAARMFTEVVEEVTREQRGGLLSFGILGTVWATSSGMYAVMQQLNVSYKVPEGRTFVRARLVAIGLSILCVLLVLTAFSLIVLGGVMQDWIGNRFGFNDALLAFFAGLRWVIIVLALLGAFAMTYYVAPNTKQRLLFVLPGSVIGTVVLIAASLGFSWYVQNFADYSAVYGSIGAVIALMLWLYIAGLALLIGSEVNALLEHHSASGKNKGESAPGVKAEPPEGDAGQAATAP
jgi:membrane protein